ncbi:DUF1214 domain-containing protein [Mesorhizobium sp. LHD-90]|uniref:DUF1214 domain-containing protein n=1 Tax=Mesorhizobium sp. LHD-90 TaxID=3071414 RepID=UPI0027E032C0|nr:DUF1214 domain-containing protein [Mesorhizobium sp. LHD-90]MDQ6436863.1 DUF1214 domain-containing protein [Mesorhizobium sp. LHD-90]
MLRTVLLTLLALAVAIGGGAASVLVALDALTGPVRVGGWTVYPNAASADADPYAKARAARDGLLPLGRAEGLAFVATRDSAGDTLRRECSYTVEGALPAARLWTLHAAGRPMQASSSDLQSPEFLSSRDVLYLPDDSLLITVDARASPGNWLATGGSGPMRLVLVFYDTPLAADADLAAVAMPQVIKAGCGG